jgi:hypothetical protein
MSKPRRGIKKLKRFVVIDSSEASKFLDVSINPDRSYLCERMPDGQLRELGADRGEPEDNTFRRDWSWVEPELNKLADEVSQLQRSLRIADEALRIKESLLEAYRERTPQAKLQAQLERRREFLDHEIRHGGDREHLSARLAEIDHLIARLGLDREGS